MLSSRRDVFTSQFWWSAVVHALVQTRCLNQSFLMLQFMLSSRLQCFQCIPLISDDLAQFMLSSRLWGLYRLFLLICQTSCSRPDYGVCASSWPGCFSPVIFDECYSLCSAPDYGVFTVISYELLQLMLSCWLWCFHQSFLMIYYSSYSPPNYGVFTRHFWWYPAVHALLQTTVFSPGISDNLLQFMLSCRLRCFFTIHFLWSATDHALLQTKVFSPGISDDLL